MCGWLVAVCCCGPLHAAQADPLTSVTTAHVDPRGISGVLNSDGYGYDFTCVINGHDLLLTQGSSESRRQYDESDTDDGFSKKERGQYATLHMGVNTVKITYKRRVPAEPFPFTLSLQVFGYPAPHFYAHVVDAESGSFEGSFRLSATDDHDFRPLYFSDDAPGTAGFLFVSQDSPSGGNLYPHLNGEMLMSMLGRPNGTIAFAGMHPGANRLVIESTTTGGPLHVFIAGPKSAFMVQLKSRKDVKETFVIQGGP